MKKLIVISLSLMLSLNSLIAQNRKAAIYNNKLFTLQNEVGKKIISFFELVKQGDLSKITQSHDQVNSSLDKLVAKVSKFKAFEGDNSLKDAVLAWVKGYETTFENEYKKMLPLLSKKDKTEEDKALLNKMHDDLIANEVTLDQKLSESQKAFAEKHKLVLGDGN